MRTSQAGQSALLLLDAIVVLKKAGVDYAIIGAMAASFHGVVRASLDADAVISLTTPALKPLEREFANAGFQTELRRGDDGDPISAVLAVKDSYDNRVDLLVGIRGLDPDAFSRAIETTFHAEKLKMISREDFIAMKLFAGGPQDIQDARRAVAVSPDTLDRSLLWRLTKRFGRQALEALKALGFSEPK